MQRRVIQARVRSIRQPDCTVGGAPLGSWPSFHLSREYQPGGRVRRSCSSVSSSGLAWAIRRQGWRLSRRACSQPRWIQVWSVGLGMPRWRASSSSHHSSGPSSSRAALAWWPGRAAEPFSSVRRRWSRRSGSRRGRVGSLRPARWLRCCVLAGPGRRARGSRRLLRRTCIRRGIGAAHVCAGHGVMSEAARVGIGTRVPLMAVLAWPLRPSCCKDAPRPKSESTDGRDGSRASPSRRRGH